MYSYTHYLRPGDAQLAKNVWDLIQQNNDPTNAQFHFTVRCSGGGAECPTGRYVLISLFPLHPCPSQYNHPIQHFFPPPLSPYFSTLPLHPIHSAQQFLYLPLPTSTHYHPTHPQFFSFLPSPFFFLLILTSRDNSLAITDATPRALPAVAQMLVCPLFFTAAETAKTLTSKSYQTNPGRRDPPSWCSPGQKFSDFETAGHTLLHEMTHIDALGAAAGLSERG